MGLRTPAEWDTQEDLLQETSNWTDNSGKGLTPAQERMDKATSPLAGQQRTEVTPKGEITSQQQAEKQQQQIKKKETEQQRAQSEYNPVEAQIAEASAKLTNFSSNLRAYVNQFLTNANAGSVGFSQENAPQYIQDPETGRTELVFGDTERDITGVVSQKEQERDRIKNLLIQGGFAKEIAGKLYANDFADIMRFGDESKLGVDTQNKISVAVDLLDRLDELVAKNAGDSAEAQAIRRQIDEADETGMVSGLSLAREDYQRLMGGKPRSERWYSGDGGESFSAIELAQIESDKIKTEVEKAVNFSTGLFGGDFASNLRTMFDSESTNIKESQERESAVHRELQDALKLWIDSQDDEMLALQKGLDNTLADVAKDLATTARASGDSEAAALWMDALTEGNLAEYFNKIISDPNNGLGAEERNKLRAAMDSLMPDATDAKSAMWSLANTGTIRLQVLDDEGNLKSISAKPSTREKLALLDVMQDPTLTTSERETKLRELINNLQVGEGKLNEIMATSLDRAKKTKIPESAINKFKELMSESMKTFAGSQTEQAFRLALGISDEVWNKTPAKERAAIMQKAWEALSDTDKKNIASKVMEQTKAAKDKAVGNMESNITLLENEQARILGVIDTGKKQVDTFLKAAEDSKIDYQNTLTSTGETILASMNPNQYSTDPVVTKRVNEAYIKATGHSFNFYGDSNAWNSEAQYWYTAVLGAKTVLTQTAEKYYPGGLPQLRADGNAAMNAYEVAKGNPNTPPELLTYLWDARQYYVGLAQSIVRAYDALNATSVRDKQFSGLHLPDILKDNPLKRETDLSKSNAIMAKAFSNVRQTPRVVDPKLVNKIIADRLNMAKTNPYLIPKYNDSMVAAKQLREQIGALAIVTIPALALQIESAEGVRDSYANDLTFSPDQIVNNALSLATGGKGVETTDEHTLKSGGIKISGDKSFSQKNATQLAISYNAAQKILTGNDVPKSLTEILWPMLIGDTPEEALPLINSDAFKRAVGPEFATSLYSVVQSIIASKKDIAATKEPTNG